MQKIHPLRAKREARNLTREKLASAIGMGAATIKRAERGEAVSPDSRQRLCEYFGCSSEELGLADQHQPEISPEPPHALLSKAPPFDEGQLPPPEYFVGRREDLAWVMLQMHEGRTTSIAALNGLGGIGKTALAAVVVRELRKEGFFPGGIGVVSCIGLTDAIDVLRRILARFDPQRRQPETNDLAVLYEVADQLLRGRKALIVLDNVEPGLDISKVIAPLKSAGATLLLTSRQALSRAAVPIEASRLLELLSSDDALELFARSLGYRRSDDLSSKERQAAQRIVTVLDRHTLAVRLAGAYAADLRLDLETFAHDLEQDPLDVPEGEIPRAVMLVFSQSTVALPPDAQCLFAALAAFATSSFGRNAALALAKDLELATPKQSVDLLVLRALVGASVDENMPLESDRERLRLHPLLRAFAAENLKFWSESDRNKAYHAVALYYVAYFNRTTDRGLSVDELNITGALEWAHHRAQDELVVTLCSGMQSFWLYRLRMVASQVFLPWGVTAAKAIAERTGTRDDCLRAADLALTYGQMLRYTGLVEEAEVALEQNLAIRREVRDRRGEEEVLSALAQLYRRSGRTALAEQYFLDALSILQEEPNRRSEGLVRLRMARIARRQGRQDEAKSYIDQALEIDRETQNTREEALTLVVLGQYHHDHGQLANAEAFEKQALALAREVNDPLSETIALNWLGRLAQDCGRLAEAEHFYQQSLGVVREVRNRLGEAVLLILWGQFAQAQGELTVAQQRYEQSLAIAREVHDLRGEGTALLCLGQLAQARGQRAVAWTSYEQSLTIARKVLDRRIEGICLGLLGCLAQEQEHLEKARQYYDHSLTIAREVHDRQSEGRTLCFMGRLVEAEGNQGNAQEYYEQSVTTARSAQDRRGEGLALFCLGRISLLDIETAESYFHQALNLLHEQDMIRYTEAACTFGVFLIQQARDPERGSALLTEAARLSAHMGLAGTEMINALAQQLEPKALTNLNSLPL